MRKPELIDELAKAAGLTKQDSAVIVEAVFECLDAPELLPEVAEGVAYVNGERAKRGNEKVAA